MNQKIFILLFLSIIFSGIATFGQDKRQHRIMVVERERPAEWSKLVLGGRFMDRFLPMPDLGGVTENTWGSANVIPRDINNGIEDPDWSYWGGNTILDKDGKYHLFVCRWPENAEKGHMAYHDSKVVHTKSDSPYGPFKVVDVVGLGHNPTWYTTKNGKYVLYVVDRCYIANNVNGPWQETDYEFNTRDRKISKQKNFLHNCSFSMREDGTFLMVNRHGRTWFGKDGISEWSMVGHKSAYPPVEGKYEDPVVWRTRIQYHLIVNDWLGRIAWYLRSKDGVSWKVEPGEAYVPGISVHETGFTENWHKYERIRMLQDEYGRAIAAKFAVIDSTKHDDLPNDNHSSKLIVVPMTIGRLLNIENKEPITSKTKTIRLKILEEEGFNPQTDMDLESLRFGASEEVNFGGGSKVLQTEKIGKDLIITFEGKGNGLTDANFAAKLMGKTSEGKLLFGYSRLPGVKYIEAILSSRKPGISGDSKITFEVENFGQVKSEPDDIFIEMELDGKIIKGSGKLPGIKPFEKTNIQFSLKKNISKGQKGLVRIFTKNQKNSLWEEDVEW